MKNPTVIIILAVLFVLVGGGSFFVGMKYPRIKKITREIWCYYGRSKWSIWRRARWRSSTGKRRHTKS